MLDMGMMKSCNEAKKRQYHKSTEVQDSLKEEILRLQKQLEDQFVVRCALQSGSRYKPHSSEPTSGNSVIKPAEDLIKEIAILEMEVVNLEKYLLAMYRKTFDKTASSFSKMDEKSKLHQPIQERNSSELTIQASRSIQKSPITNPTNFQLPKEPTNKYYPPEESSNVPISHTLLDSSIHRTHSSLSQTAASCSFRASPPRGTVAEALHSHHSLPLSMLERGEDAASSFSLAEHLATNVFVDRVTETPNWLSEELVKCISAIYCQLAEPPLFNQGHPSSPISFSSSLSESPPLGTSEAQVRETSSFNSWLNNPFQVDDSREFSGSFPVVEVQGIRRDDWGLKRIEHMLQNFRSLVSQLEEVDPRKMKHEEKLAFWINIHNVLVMHAYLVYGIPQSSLKRTSLILKAAYNIGGHTISVDMIQSSILGCRLPRPGQWLQSLFFPKSKFKARDARRAYAIGRSQPLVQFALSSGSHSDPMVRIYTPKRLFQELEMAKEEYIQSSCSIQKERKILLPKIVESYAKEISLSSASLLEMIEHSVPNFTRKNFQQPQQEKLGKKIEWIPHTFTFRYILSPELTK